MVDFDGAGDCSDDDGQDDIARFEQQCIARAQAEGLHLVTDDYDPPSDEEGDAIIKSKIWAAEPATTGDWQKRCKLLQEKLARREAEAGHLKNNLDLLKTDVPAGGDVVGDLKGKLVDLTKKNRRLQVTLDSQKTRLQQLEAEAKKPREEIRRQAEEMAAQQLGDNGLEDWKQKYLLASNKLQDTRQELQDIRVQLQRYKKVVLKELGSDEVVEKALVVADDPADTQWRGRAAQISQLKRHVQELKDHLRRGNIDIGEGSIGDPNEVAPGDTPQRGRRGKADQASDKDKAHLAAAAEKRREDFEKLQEEVERLRSDQADSRRKREAIKSRATTLEGQVKELKGHVQTLVSKSENDDELVAALRREMGRPPMSANGAAPFQADDAEALRREIAELQMQLDKQSHVVLQLRQRNLAASCENGSAKLGPKSAEASISERQLVERVRYLEAENARHTEQVRLLRDKLGEESRPGSGMSCRGSPPAPSGVSVTSGLSAEELQKQNDVLKREIVRLRTVCRSAPTAADEDSADEGPS
mmetsp:Transcript_2994/g.7654  ORF Transcript_2994/g.7654 Transcript_2994/m.7654 type:complete len:531 (+) Transcript_2994:40-1632(+)